MAKLAHIVSEAALDALTEFSEEFDQALATGEITQWASQFGLMSVTNAIKTRYPIPVSAAGYKRRKGDDKLRSLYQRTIEMTVDEWQDGVEEYARIIEAPEFVGWIGEPARMAEESLRLPNTLVAELLADNPILEFDGKAMFANDHPVNVFDLGAGTFDNLHSTAAIDSGFIAAVRTRFRQRKSPNGKNMGLRFTHLLVPPALEEQAFQFLESNLMLAAHLIGGSGSSNTQETADNIYKGAVQLIVGDELEEDDYIYPIAANKPVFPWIVQSTGTPEEIRYDKNDAKYKDTGKIGVKYVVTTAAGAALPHAIERVQVTG